MSGEGGNYVRRKYGKCPSAAKHAHRDRVAVFTGDHPPLDREVDRRGDELDRPCEAFLPIGGVEQAAGVDMNVVPPQGFCVHVG